jgi:hypothetical protein
MAETSTTTKSTKSTILADLKNASPIAIVKVGLTLLILGTIVYFVIKYWKYFKVGAGLIAAATALPFLADVIGGVLGVGGSVVAFLVGFYKKRIAKAEEDQKNATTEEEKDQIQSELEDNLTNTSETVKAKASGVDPDSTEPINLGDTTSGVSAAVSNDMSYEEAQATGEGAVSDGMNEVNEMTQE